MKSLLFYILIVGCLPVFLLNAEDFPAREKNRLWEGYISHLTETRDELSRVVGILKSADSKKFDSMINQLGRVKSVLDKVLVTKLQTELFAALPDIGELIDRREPVPESVNLLYGDLENLSVPLLRSAAEHVIDENGSVNEEVVKQFTWLLSVDSLYFGSNWEDEPLPLDPAGIMILNPEVVKRTLMARPWRHASRFLWGDTPEEYFRRYALSGNGLEPLKRGWVENRSKIEEEFRILQAWVHQKEVEAGER